MIAIISPAKNMKPSCGNFEGNAQKPVFLEQTEILSSYLKTWDPWDFEGVMKVNEAIALLAFENFQNFSVDQAGTAAVLTYDGLVFKNIGAGDWRESELLFANKHLRILSGLYGILRPLDGILPYRLEMQCRLKLDGGNLYRFWGSKLYEELYKNQDVVLNLASEEYAKCIRKYKKEYDRFIDVEFLVWRKGKLTTMATWAKMARGQMVRYIIENKIDKPEDVQNFSWKDYQFEENLSNTSKYVFVIH